MIKTGFLRLPDARFSISQYWRDTVVVHGYLALRLLLQSTIVRDTDSTTVAVLSVAEAVHKLDSNRCQWVYVSLLAQVFAYLRARYTYLEAELPPIAAVVFES